MSQSLLRTSLRSLSRRRWLSLLCVIGIALGVAVVVAIDLANESAQRAFTFATESVTGRATHHIIGGPNGIDEGVYSRLRTGQGVRLVAPVVEDYVQAEELGEQPFRLLGVDPFAEPPFRSYLASDEGAPLDALVPLLTEPNTVVLAEDIAERYGVQAGDMIHVRVGTDEMELNVVGLLAPQDEYSRRALSNLLIADIATAQEVLDRVGQLSRIDVLAPRDDPTSPARLERIESVLPDGVRLIEAAKQAQSVQQLTNAFELNLQALSLLALVVGTFLIYNTMTFSVVQRRATLGTLRSLGVTGREIFGLILFEAGILGVIGSALGLLAGVLLGQSVVGLVTQTINDLYFVVSVRDIAISPLVLTKGAVLGIVAAVVAAVGPAYEATSVPPAGTLRRSTVESRARQLVPVITVGGVVMAAIGAGLLALPTRNLVVGFAGVLAVVLGFAGLTPALTLLSTRLVAMPLGRLFGTIGRMAPRTVSSALSRTGLAVAALMVAVSVSIGVGLMIDAFRGTVERWLGTTLQADVYISAPSMVSNRSTTPLDADIPERVEQVEGVATVEESFNTTIDSPDVGRVQLAAVEWERPRQEQLFICAMGGQAGAQQALQTERAVLVSEPLAYRQELTCGDQIGLLTDQGRQVFDIAGVFHDYSSEQGVVMMDIERYRTLWNDETITSLTVYAADTVDSDTVVGRIQDELAGEGLLVRSNRGLRESALAIFDRTFAITGALQVLAVVVAFIGVLSALMALQLERTREFGTLRAIGLTPRQLWGVTLLETGLMGSLAGILAWPTGLTLAAILVYIINRRSFGWTIQFSLTPEEFAQAFLIATVAALLAGLYPAWRLARLEPADAIRAE